LLLSIIMDVVEVGAILALVTCSRRRCKHQFWVHPIYSARLSVGNFHTDFQRYRYYPDMFFTYCRMSVPSFNELLTLVGPSISRQDTNWRRSVPDAERLAVTSEVRKFCKTYPVHSISNCRHALHSLPLYEVTRWCKHNAELSDIQVDGVHSPIEIHMPHPSRKTEMSTRCCSTSQGTSTAQRHFCCAAACVHTLI
jgi:hypothetical protein